MRGLVLISLCAGLAGCGGYFNTNERIAFDGVQFRTKSETPDKDDKKVFLVSVRPATASLEGAREAGRYEGTSYCINQYGTSRIDWEVGPDTEELTVVDNTLTLRGRCDP